MIEIGQSQGVNVAGHRMVLAAAQAERRALEDIEAGRLAKSQYWRVKARWYRAMAMAERGAK